MPFWKKGLNLHALSRSGRLKKIVEIFSNDHFEHQQEVIDLKAQITERKGAFGFTVLHEAVAGDNLDILKYLLSHVDKSEVNIKADGGFTLLHLAASTGSVNISKYLVGNGAEMNAEDEYGKTPKATAEISSKRGVVNYFKGLEIIKEAESNSEKLTELLQAIKLEDLELSVLDKALISATKNDNPSNIGMLILKGAQNFEECLKIAEDEKKPRAYSILLLVIAAATGSSDILTKIYKNEASAEDLGEDDGLSSVRKCVNDSSVSTVVPIEIARRKGNFEVRHKLLLHTDVNETEGCVYWSGLRLLILDGALLEKIQWVKHFRLARNGLIALPEEVGLYLCQVVKLELEHNDLKTLPESLLTLPCLEELNLSHNKLNCLPKFTEWSSSLKILDISHNHISALPDVTPAPYNNMQVLDLSHNRFNAVPQCVCSSVSLQVLNLSENTGISSLPPNMAHLPKLRELHLEGLKNLESPPKKIHGDISKVMAYLNEKLEKQ